MGLRTEAEAIAAEAKQRYGVDAIGDDPSVVDAVARWTALDGLHNRNYAGWLQLVHKYTPALPQLLAVAAEVDQGTGPTTGLVMGQLLDLAQSVTWEEIEQLENK